MSKTVDQRVVEMRFDNRHFEKNVQTSMSTLDKLKQKLNLNGAAKGLEAVGSAAKKIDMSGIGRSVETVTAKFSAFEVIATTALVNITNQAVNAGKKLVSSLSIDQVTAGWEKYEQKTASVQTLMNSTGKSVDEINQYLEKLMWFSDETSYGFTDMTSALATMVSSGGDIDKLIPMITGVANATAYAGKGAAEFSRIMQYAINQAYSLGYMQVQDWKSIEGATVNSKQLVETLIAAGEALGKIKEGEVTIETFRSTLKDGWLDKEVMEEGFGKFAEFSNAVYEAVESGVYDTAADAMADMSSEYSEIGVKAFESAQKAKSFTEAIEATKDAVSSGWMTSFEIIFGNYEEATELWTNLTNVLWDVFASGAERRNNILEGAFGNTWDKLCKKIEAAGFSTDTFSDTLYQTLKDNGVIIDHLITKYGSLANVMNVGKVKGEYIIETFRRLLGIQNETAESIDAVTMSAEELEKVVNRVIRGEFGNGEERLKALTEAGYDYATVQNKVNEILGSSVRHTSELTDEQKEMVAGLAKLSDAQLKEKGYTEEQIAALRDLEKMATLTGTSFDELVKKLERPSGRDLLIDSFANMWESLSQIFELIKEAWTNIFGEKTEEEQSESLYEIIDAFHDLTESMKISEETADSFRTIMEGVFAGMQIGGSLASKTLSGGLKLLNSILNLMGTDILGLATIIAEKIIEFNQWIKDNTLFGYGEVYDKLAQILEHVYNGVKKCVKAFAGLETTAKIVEKVSNLLTNLIGAFGGSIEFFKLETVLQTIDDFFTKLESWIKGIDDAENIGEYIIEGIFNGLNKAAHKLLDGIRNILVRVWGALGDFFNKDFQFKALGANVISGLYEGMSGGLDKLFNIAKQVFVIIYNTIADLFDVHSPSRVMMALGGFIIAGLIAGLTLKNGELGSTIGDIGLTLFDGFKNVVSKVINGIKEIDFGDIVAVGLSGGLIYAIKKLSDALELFGNPLESLAGMFKSIGGLFKSLDSAVKNWANAQKYNAIGKMILNMAISLGILVGAVIALCYVIDKLGLDWKVVTGSVLVIGALAGVLFILAKACESLNSVGKVSLNTVSLVGMALSLVLVAGALKLLTGILPEDAQKTLVLFAGMIIGMGALLLAVSKITSNMPDGGSIKGLGKVFTKLAWSLLIMIGVIKLASMLKASEIFKGAIVIGLIGVFYAAVISMAKSIDGKAMQYVQRLGSLMTRIAWALLLMVGVIKVASMLTVGEIAKGSAVIAAISIFFGAFALFAKFLANDAKNISAIGNYLLKVSAALLISVLAIKMVAGMSAEEIAKGVSVIYAIGALFGALTYVSKYGGQNATKAGVMLLEMSIAMLILSFVLIILKDLDPDGIVQALGIMTYLSALFAGLIVITKYAGASENLKGVLISLTAAIAVLAVALVALSLLDSKKLAVASGCLSLVIGVFALLVKATSSIQTGKKTWTKSLVTLIVLTALVALLAYVISMLSELKPERATGAAEALAIVLLSLSSALWILGKSKSLGRRNLTNMYETLAILTGIMVIMAFVLVGMKDLDPTSAIGSAVALGILLLALSASFAIIANSKSLAKKNIDNMLGTLGMLALVVVVLAVAISMLKNVDPLTAIGNATALGLLLNALSAALLIISNSKSISQSKLPGILKTLTMLTLVTAVLGLVIYGLRDVDPVNAIGNAVALGLLLNALSAALVVVSNSKSISQSKLPGILATLAMLALVTSVLGLVIYGLRDVDPLNAIGNAVALGLLLNALSAALVVVSNSKSINQSKLPGILSTLGILTLVVAALGAVIYCLRDVNPVNAIGNAIALGLLVTIFVALLKPLSAAGKSAKQGVKGIAALTAMVIPLVAFGFAIAAIPDISGKAESLIALGAVLTAMTLLLVPLILIGKFATDAVFGIAALTAMVVPLMAFAYAISVIPDISAAQQNVIFLTKIMTAMTLLLIPLTLIGTLAVNALFGVVTLTAMVIPLVAFAYAIATIPDVTAAQKNIELLVGVMTAMTLLLVPLTLIGVLAPLAILGVAALTSMVVPLCTFAVAINLLPDITSCLPTLMILMSVLNTMTNILTTIAPLAPLALIGVAALEALVLVISAFGVFATAIGALMEYCPKLEEFLNKGIDILVGIGEGLGRVVGSFLVGFGEEIVGFLPTLGQALSGFMLGAMPFIAGINMVNDDLITHTKSLAEAILVLAVADFITGMLDFGNNSSGLLAAAASLNNFIVSIIPTLAMLQTVDSSVIDSVGVLADALLKLTAADLISSLASFLGTKLNLDDFATQMAGYGEGVAAFNNAIKDANIDADAVEAAANAGKVMAELQSSIEPVGGVIGFFKGEKNLEDFGSQMKAYGEALVAFCKTVSADGAIDSGAVEAAANAGKMMTELQSSIEATGGVIDYFTGEQNLETFGNQMKAYGEALVGFCSTISADGAMNEDAVSTANRIGGIMSTLQKNLPEDKWFDGRMNLAQFGEKIAKFGGYIADYAKKVGDMDIDKVNTSTSAAKTLGKLAKDAGNIDPDTVTNFECISTIGDAMKDYTASVSELDPTIVSSSITSANRLRNFIASLVNLDNSGLSNFRVSTIGNSMRTYAASVADLDPTVVSSSITSANRLRNFIASLVSLDSSGISNFKVGTIGSTIRSYANSVLGTDFSGVATSISAANKLKNFISGLAGLDASGVGTFTSSVSQLGQVSLDGFIEAFSGAGDKLTNIGSGLINSLVTGIKSKSNSVKTGATSIVKASVAEIKTQNKSFKSAGSTFITQLANGIKSKKSTAAKAASDVASASAEKADNYYNDFYSAGSSLVDGFAAGISANTFKAEAKAAAMAKAAYDAAKEALDINSPSKVFRSLGTCVPEGFAMGIEKLGNVVKAASVGMTDTAIDGLRGAISRISDVVNGEIDSQPVIRPVLDLSEIQSGAGSIDGLFGMTPSVGVMSNIRAINSMMHQNQNRANDDVVSAIDKLRGDLGNIQGNSYTIGNVTYGSDSEVASAIETLVRAATVERRI